jgi:hypothetical protein
MATAIKKELAQTTYASLVEGYARQRRPGFILTCGESDCTQEYLVYYGPEMEEAEVRDLLGEQITRGHPAHIAIIAFNEPVPRATQHREVSWNPATQEWFCMRCGRTSDHTFEDDARQELENFKCE